MAPALSTYLNVVRFGAAIVVVLHHIWPMLFPNRPIPWPGHDAVVVFFVLSGFVIAHATDRPGVTLPIYVQHRVARVLSVAFPALLISSLVGLFLPTDVTIYAAPAVRNISDFWLRILLNSLFLAQSWSLDLSPPVNAPYWSLNFEVWYYVLFGVWTFFSGFRRYLFLLLAALIAGPKILLLMPIWILGVITYRKCPHMSERSAMIVMVSTLVIGLGFFWFDVSIVIRSKLANVWPDFMMSLHGANQVFGDSILGLVVCANFIAAVNLPKFLRPITFFQNGIKVSASLTFSIYLYHMPLFALFYGVFGWHSVWVILPFLVSVVILSFLTEMQLPFIRNLLGNLPSAGGTGRRSVQSL